MMHAIRFMTVWQEGQKPNSAQKITSGDKQVLQRLLCRLSHCMTGVLYIQDELGHDPVSDITLVLDNNNMFMFPNGDEDHQ